MPQIIVQTSQPGGGRRYAIYTERITSAHMSSPHQARQLVERLRWAIEDAEALETAKAAAATPVREHQSSPDIAPPPRRVPARQVAATAILALLVMLMSAAVAAARPWPGSGHGWKHGRLQGDQLQAGGADGAVAHQWYDITDQTVAAAAFPEPVTQSRTWSVSWLAAARAASGRRDPNFEIPAFAQALHDALVAQVPAQQTQLDSDLAATLARVPDGPDKAAGISAGRRQAAVVLAARQGDGLDTASVDIPYTPPAPGPGVWQPTPPTYLPAIRAGEGNARPFLLRSGDQFDPGPPPALGSRRYLRALAEVRAYGQNSSTVRSAQETDVARFWEPAINIQYVQILRDVLADTGAPLAWSAQLVAAFNVVTTDAQIAIYNSKFKYAFWRPVTAIRTGSVDPDPAWTPFFTTPRYPDWLSGHGGVAGAAQAVLTAYLGPTAPGPIAVTSPTDPGVTHQYSSWAQVTREVINARVWEGIHFRFSDVVGARVGREVAGYDLRRLTAIGL